MAQAAAALVKQLFSVCLHWSGRYLVTPLRVSLADKAKPEVKTVACEVLAEFCAVVS